MFFFKCFTCFFVIIRLSDSAVQVIRVYLRLGQFHDFSCLNYYDYADIPSSYNIIIISFSFCLGKRSCKLSILYSNVSAWINTLPSVFSYAVQSSNERIVTCIVPS